MDTTDNYQGDEFETVANSLLMPDEDAPAPDEDQTEGEDTEAEADEVDAEDEDTEADEADGEDNDDEEDEDQEQPQTLKVKVDGKDVEVTLDDLKRSYSGQAYIQQRMQEVANHKREVEQVYQALAQEREAVTRFLQQAQQGVPQPPKMPAQELAQRDPAAFNREMARYLQEQQRYDQFQQQAQTMTQQQSAAQQRAQAAYLAEQAELLKQHIPEFADPDKAPVMRQKLVQAGADYGFSADELAAVMDARTVRVLADAQRWRELQASKGKMTEKAAKARPVMKPGAKKQGSNQTKVAKAAERMKRSGDVDSVAQFLLT